MKIKVFSAVALMALALGMTTACSSNDDLSDGGSNTPEVAKTNYVRVNLVDMNATGASTAKANPLTRADDTESDYTNGSDDEGKVGKVRFYFFNQNGGAYNLANSVPAGVNFLDEDFTNREQTTNDNPATVERRTAATLVLDGVDGNTVPASVVAIVNPDALVATNGLDNASKDTTALMQIISTANATQDGFDEYSSSNQTHHLFLMSNSVYQKNNVTIFSQHISGDQLRSSSDDALQHPVDIYVERLAAKVTVNASTTVPTTEPTNENKWGTVTFTPLEENATAQTKPAYFLGETTVYVWNSNTSSFQSENRNLVAAINGWNIADGNDKGYLVKNFGTLSSTGVPEFVDLLQNGATTLDPRWNSDNYLRSFWEVIPSPYKRVSYSWNASNIALGGNAYTMPNTPTKDTKGTAATLNRRASVNTSNPDMTKVLIGATLLYKDGQTWKPIDLWRFQGRYYTSETDVKRAIAAIHSDIEKTTSTSTTSSKITYEDIHITEPSSYAGSTADYRETVGLNNVAGTTYTKNGTALSAATEGAPIDMENNDYVLHYGNGHTYYYTTIQHLWNGSDDNLGKFGVVRNHWYQVNIQSIVGPGTPVPTPDEPIIPVTPEETLSYLSARINVLQWRVVTNNVNIDGSLNTTQTNPTPATGSAKRR